MELVFRTALSIFWFVTVVFFAIYIPIPIPIICFSIEKIKLIYDCLKAALLGGEG